MARVTPDRPAAVHDSQLNTSGGGRTQDPASAMTGIPLVSRSAAGPSTPAHPSRDSRAGVDPDSAAADLALSSTAADQPSPQPRERPGAAGSPAPDTRTARLDRAPVQDRGREIAPAGGAASQPAPPAGSRGLRGKEFRDAMRRAQSGRTGRRKTPSARPAVPDLGPSVDGDGLTATAHCICGCEWTAGPGAPAEVDKQAERHTVKPPKHPTAVVAGLAGIRRAAG